MMITFLMSLSINEKLWQHLEIKCKLSFEKIRKNKRLKKMTVYVLIAMKYKLIKLNWKKGINIVHDIFDKLMQILSVSSKVLSLCNISK